LRGPRPGRLRSPLSEGTAPPRPGTRAERPLGPERPHLRRLRAFREPAGHAHAVPRGRQPRTAGTSPPLLHHRPAKPAANRPAAPGVTAQELTAGIQKQTGLRARTTREFAWDCVRYYLKNTGIPVNFGITITVALIVGAVVAGHTFYLFTVDNLKQFGALKAIGVSNLRLTGMILLQAFSVGALGFAIGTGIGATV